MERLHRLARFFIVLATCAAPSGCVDDAEPIAGLEQHQFFENSTRRDATSQESKLVVKLGGCAAFFVANDQGKTYMATARHCVNYSITSWCNNGGRVRDNQGRRGTCKRIIAADANHDIAVFEVTMPYVPASHTVLRLASYQPAVDTPLKMIGYPADNDPETARHGKLTTTEDCWILHESVPSPYDDLQDRSSLHNCSTYGGNSGGPMYVDGTLDAVGLPFTYVPGDYHRRSSDDLDTAACMAQMADFVGRHRDKLEAAGVIISDSPPG